MAWQQPKTNWDTHPKAIEPADLNRIEGNIEVVREQNNLPIRVQVVPSLPSPGVPGRLVFNDSDKRFYFDTGTVWHVQSAPNLGQVIITPTNSNQTIPEGYHDGSGYVKPNQTGCVFNQQNRSYADVSFSLTIPSPFVATVTICLITTIKFSSSHLDRTRSIYVNGSKVASVVDSGKNVLNKTLTGRTGTLNIRGTASRVEDDIDFLYLMAIAKW